MTKKPTKKKISKKILSNSEILAMVNDKLDQEEDDASPSRHRGKEAVLYSEHLTVVLDEKIRATIRATIAWLDLGSSLRRQCTFGSSLCEEIFESVGSSPSGTKEIVLDRRIKQLQDLSASHAAYVKHLRIVNTRLDDVLKFTDKIAEEVNEIHSARSVQASLSAMDADTEEFKAACNIVLKEIGKRDPHLMSLVHGVTPLPNL